MWRKRRGGIIVLPVSDSYLLDVPGTSTDDGNSAKLPESERKTRRLEERRTADEENKSEPESYGEEQG